jgi:hypothetical protein
MKMEEKRLSVRLSRGGWCGATGACTALVLEPTDSSYRVVAWIRGTRLPIRVLTQSWHGWRSVGVWVQDGWKLSEKGEPVLNAYEAEYRFDGKTYQHNPSVSPARSLEGKVAGEVVIPESAKEQPLYP